MLSAWLLLRSVSLVLVFVICTTCRTTSGSANKAKRQSGLSPQFAISHPTCGLAGGRHEAERVALLERIDRHVGKWDKKHPRWQILEALHGFDRYETIVGAGISRFEDLYNHTPKKHKKLLSSAIGYDKNFNDAHKKLAINAKLCKLIVNFALPFYDITRQELDTFIQSTDSGKPNHSIQTTVSQTLKHMVRDWSHAGLAERNSTFPYILNTLSTNLLISARQKVLVPGAGLGRLPHEISRLSPNVEVTSSEWSASMNIAYRFLTSQDFAKSFEIYPFLESWSHARTRSDISQSIQITPQPSTSNPNLLIEGDFTALSGSYSAIVTLFFIDTARNIVTYLESIYSLLEPGGLWINTGPLLYGTAPLVQLTVDEIVILAERIGFVFEERSEVEDVRYDFGQGSMYGHGYVCQRWVARKVMKEERGGWW